MSNLVSEKETTCLSFDLAEINGMSLGEAALAYAAMGIPVFPLRASGKTPLPGSRGFLDATTDATTIGKWWVQTPSANIGIATGPQAGFFVLDVDGDEGRESLRLLTEQNGPLPVTVASKTGRGEHLLFRDRGGYRISASAVGAKLDIRTEGGYIVGPPSIHPSGHRYEWVRDGVVWDAPDWLLGRMSDARAKTKVAKSPVIANDAGIPEGGRNAALASFAGLLRRKGIEGEALYELVMTHNLSACEPPLEESEVRGIARSISNYQTGRKHDLTDLGNVQRFVALHGENLRCVVPGGFWLQWQESHWHEIEKEVALKLVFDVPGAILLEAAYEDDTKAATALRKHAITTQGRSRLEAILELSRSILNINSECLDTNPMLLSVRNGQLDLATGTLVPHRREDYITKLIDVDYDPAAPRPLWSKFIGEVTCANEELARFLQRIGGYCLTGLTKEQVMFIFYGHGANGKSTFIEVLHTLMGPYGSKTPMTTFLSTKGDKATHDLARLRGTRFVSAVEAGRGDRLDEALIKVLTGGDTIAARLLFKNFFDYRPAFKIAMSVNDLPRIEAGDAAINRRLIVVPFGATFSEAACDQHLFEKLMGEASGILAWLVEGCSDWLRGGLRRPSAVMAATDNYISTNDTLGEFIKENCTEEDGYATKTGDFFRAYVPWLKEVHGEEISKTALGRLMSKKGYASKPRNGDRQYMGIALQGKRF